MILAALLAATPACGKKGPPQAPLRLVPAAPTEPSVKRIGDEAQLRLVLPTRNIQPEGPLALDRIEVYAMTIAPGAPPPANRDLLTRKYVVGTIAVKPPPGEDEPAPSRSDEAADKRPGPGDTVTFVEQLTPDKLAPIAAPPPPPAAAPAAAAVPAAPAAPAPLPYPIRVYGVRGLTKGGRPGQPATRVQLPVVAVPPPPSGLKINHTEKSVVVEWTAPEVSTPAAVTFNVYRPEAAAPLNPQPLAAAPFDSPGLEFGVEQCFAVRTVERVGGVAIESALSPPACVTPKDTFPPAAPKGVGATASPGVVDLTWDSNTEADLGGYLVLRADAADATPAPLMQAPIADTHYLDKTAKPDVQYFYFIVAVDKSTPPNQSAPSARYTITAK